MSLIDEFAAFVASIRSRETLLPWGPAQVWDLGRGRPVVALHGVAGGRRIFFRLVPLLAERFRVVVPPLRGEARPEPAVRREDLLDDLGALLETLDLNDVCLFGTSFGGYLALAYGARRDPRVGSIVVQGAFSRYHLRVVDRVALALTRVLPGQLSSAYFVYRVLRGREHRMLARHAPGIEILAADWIGKTPFASARRRTQILAQSPAEPPERVALTFAHGREDAVVPFAAFEHLRALRPDARAVAWDGVAHLAPLTHPHLVAELFE